MGALNHITGNASLSGQIQFAASIFQFLEQKHAGFLDFLKAKSQKEGLASLDLLTAYIASQIWQIFKSNRSRDVSDGAALSFAACVAVHPSLLEYLHPDCTGDKGYPFVGGMVNERFFRFEPYSATFSHLTFKQLEHAFNLTSINFRYRQQMVERELLGLSAIMTNDAVDDIIDELEGEEELAADFFQESHISFDLNTMRSIEKALRNACDTKLETGQSIVLYEFPQIGQQMKQPVLAIASAEGLELRYGYFIEFANTYPLPDLRAFANYWSWLTNEYEIHRQVMASILELHYELAGKPE